MFAAIAVQVIHDNDHMSGGWWWVMGIGWLIFLAIVVTVGIVLARSLSSRDRGSRSAQDILADRFARGEIDEDEYRKRRDALR